MQSPATEVPIPVLRGSDDKIPSPISQAQNAASSNSKYGTPSVPSTLPTISITKPPVPMPVSLPTALDIVSSSPIDTVQFEDDVESGRLREGENIGLVTSTKKTRTSKSPLRRETSDSSASALPLSPLSQEVDTTPVPSSSSLPPIVPDLLADEPLEILEASSQAEGDHAALSENEEDANPDATIRLVGGGGLVGISLPEIEEPAAIEVPEPETPVAHSDAVSVSSLASTEQDKKNEKTHKKSKSSLALKRLSQLGNLRKTESISSTKDTVPPLI